MKQTKKITWLALAILAYITLDSVCFAVATTSGLGSVALHVTDSLVGVGKLITAGAYVGGFGFAVAALVKFKAYKENPTQIQLSLAVVLLFVGAALIFIPSVFKTSGATLFGTASGVGKISGFTAF